MNLTSLGLLYRIYSNLLPDWKSIFHLQVGRKSPYGEGTINIFDTPELKRLGQKKGMTGAAYIGEWITSRVYSKNAVCIVYV